MQEEKEKKEPELDEKGIFMQCSEKKSWMIYLPVTLKEYQI